MTARDDYPILVEWLAGTPMTGMNGDFMEIAVSQALDEIDRLRAESDTYAGRLAEAQNSIYELLVKFDVRPPDVTHLETRRSAS